MGCHNFILRRRCYCQNAYSGNNCCGLELSCKIPMADTWGCFPFFLLYSPVPVPYMSKELWSRGSSDATSEGSPHLQLASGHHRFRSVLVLVFLLRPPHTSPILDLSVNEWDQEIHILDDRYCAEILLSLYYFDHLGCLSVCVCLTKMLRRQCSYSQVLFF